MFTVEHSTLPEQLVAARLDIATACLSGTLEDKLAAAAAAGFQGVEIFEDDLVVSPWSPRRIRRHCADLGLTIDLYQPFTDFEAVPPDVLMTNLRRAERKFDVMRQLGVDTLLVCSSVSPDAVDDDDLAAEQLHTLACRAAGHGIRIAYEALAWGRFVNTFEHAWRIVRRAAHPGLGLCLDSFHVLSQGTDLAALRVIPGSKVFFVQLADAPRPRMDALHWSEHHRLFPGQGSFDLSGFVSKVLATGYTGPLSLEVFNDVFRQTDPSLAAVDAMRSVVALKESLGTHDLPPAPRLTGHAFTELAVDEISAPRLVHALRTLGFAHVGQHRSKPVQLWQQGSARVLLNSTKHAAPPATASITALAVESADPDASAQRAARMLAPLVPRFHEPHEADLPVVTAPGGTAVFFCRPAGDKPDGNKPAGDWLGDFDVTGELPEAHLVATDHVALTEPFDDFDRAALFYRTVLGLRPNPVIEFAAPFGLMRTQATTDTDRRVRIALSTSLLRRGEWAPAVPEPQHIAFTTNDAIAAAKAMRAAGPPLLEIPANYYEHLDARPDQTREPRERPRKPGPRDDPSSNNRMSQPTGENVETSSLKKSAEATQSATWSLHGRDKQMRRIEQLMRSTAEGRQGHLVVLESGIGTGKSRLLHEAMTLARQQGFAVLAGMPASRSQVNSSDDRHTDRDNRLAKQEEQLGAHLRRGPVLVTLDDAQWTDKAVLRALGALIPKLDDAPVLWLIALRTGHTNSANGLLLRNLAWACRSEWFEPLEPLSGDAAASIAGDLLNAAADEDLVALCEGVGGTPQAITSLVLGLRDEGCLAVVDGVARLTSGPLVSGVASAVAADPCAQLPQTFLRLACLRLRELSRQAQDMLQIAAVLGRSFAPHDLAEMLGTRPVELLQPLTEALAAGLLCDGSGKFIFHREPVWRAVLGTVPQTLRSMLHWQAATMLLARPHDETQAVAVHLVHCAEPGDMQAVATIHQAAQRLLTSSPQAAAALAIRALRLTRPGEPNRIALGTTAAAALVRLGKLSQAVELTQELLHSDERVSTQPIYPLRTWLATALMLRGDIAPGWIVSQYTSAITAGSAGDVELSPEPLLLNALAHYNPNAAIGMAEQVLMFAERYSVDVRVAALMIRAMASWRDGRVDAAIESAENAVELRGQLTRIDECDPLWTKAWLLTRLRKLDGALAAADTALRTMETQGTGVFTAIPLALRATILLAMGDIAAAEADANAGLAVSTQAEMPLFEPQLSAVLVLAALRRGDLVAAANGLRRLEMSTLRERAHPSSVMRRLLAGLVVSARLSAHAAMDEIRETVQDPAMRKQLVLEDPSATAWSVRTALAAGEKALAELIVTTAEEITSANPQHVSVFAAARHGRALLDGDLVSLSELARLYSDPWAVASAIEDLGSIQRETDREQAVKELDRAMAIYEAVGAERDLARVRYKLRRLGVRRRHWNHKPRPDAGWDSLTGSEEKVARLVAQGLTNRQVAKELFVSPHTVGFHLRQVYRKLSIQSRVDLARIAP